MPPKKKVRMPSRAESTPPGDAVEQAEKKENPTPMKEGLGTETVVSDPWTDEQETWLFKSMIRWKPVGTLDRLNYMADCTDSHCEACTSTFG